jgi:hypothetical protein
MTWPTSDVATTNNDAGTDSPASWRTDSLDLAQKVNQIRNHVTAFIQGLLANADAAAARTTLGAAASGTNTDITSLGAVTGVTATAGDSSAKLATTAFVAGAGVKRSYLAGLGMSTAGGSAIISVAAGSCADSTNATVMNLAAWSKTTAAYSEGVGLGGLDTGSIADGWYHVFVIGKTDGTTDVLISLSPTAPTMPSGYTLKRRIGSALIVSSTVWQRFEQLGDLFLWVIPVLDLAFNDPGATGVTRTMSVPTGVQVEVLFSSGLRNSSSGVSTGVVWSSLYQQDQAPSETGVPLWTGGALASNATGGVRASFVQHRILTNASAQIRSRLTASDANVTLYAVTNGWVDTRGRDS